MGILPARGNEMRFVQVLPVLACVVVAGCSGGGGGTGSAGTLPVAGGGGGSGSGTGSTSPANTSITGLVANQTFTSTAAGTSTTINLQPAVIMSAIGTQAPISVRYDAASKSYTVETQGRSQTFAPGDIQPSQQTGETIYRRDDAGLRQYLTLVTTPYSGITANRYVGLGYWQRSSVANGQQTLGFDSFVYGLVTPDAAVPRSGTATYGTDALGFVTTPGNAPRAFTGQGVFDVDLGLGIFSAKASVYEYDLSTPEARTGGGIEYAAGGRLASNNGFSGNFTYSGRDTLVSGTLQGQFFGQGAEELGATFSANDGKGAVVSGALTGQRGQGGARSNLSLLNLTGDQLFYAREANYTLERTLGGGAYANTHQGITQMTLGPDGSVLSGGAVSSLPSGKFTNANRADTGNFFTYSGDVGGQPAKFSLYKSGAANSELQLTYASFGIWEGGANPSYGPFNGKAYRVYGFDTPRDLLARRTGTASYAGVVYATGIRGGATTFDVGGTSSLLVDFDAQRFSGALALTDKGAGGAAIGNWTFADVLARGQIINTTLKNGAVSEGSLMPALFGPDGEEFGASFVIEQNRQNLPNSLVVVGATVGKRR